MVARRGDHVGTATRQGQDELVEERRLGKGEMHIGKPQQGLCRLAGIGAGLSTSVLHT
jgi:hypothetical protein